MAGNHEALKRAIRAARSQAGISSDSLLAGTSGVHLQTIQNWMYGKTTPRPSELSKVARALDKPLDYFMAVYEDRPPEPPPLVEAVRELIDEIRGLVTELREDRERGQDAASAILRAAEIVGSLSRRPRDGGSTERPVPDGSTG